MLIDGRLKHALPALMLVVAFGLTGCSAPGVIVGAGATVGVAAAQERTVGQAVDDTTININISSRMLQKDEALFRRVDVTVHQGRVLLTGSVPEPDERVEAVRLAWQVNGVKEILNEIQVNDTSGVLDYAKDTWITTQLRTKILGDREISDINYTIETVNGTVYLLGVAQDETELQRVAGHARNIRGVAKVVSHVQVKQVRS